MKDPRNGENGIRSEVRRNARDVEDEPGRD